MRMVDAAGGWKDRGGEGQPDNPRSVGTNVNLACLMERHLLHQRNVTIIPYCSSP